MNPPIRPSVAALDPYTPGEQLAFPDLVKLNTNENPYPPSPAVARALAGYDVSALRLYPPPLFDALRERIAQLHGCSPDAVFVGNGSDEVLRLATFAFTRPGGAAASFNPSYSLYPVLAATAELSFEFAPLAPDFSFLPPPDSLSATLFFLTQPNAPTGVLYPLADIEAFARRFPGVVAVDQAYADFSDSPDADATPLALSLPNVLVCRTLSKSWSLAGLRLGYAIGPLPLIRALYKIKDSYNVDALAQTVALAALSDVPWMQANAARVRESREELRAELLRRGWTVVPSHANFLFARPPAPLAAADVFRTLREAHVLVRHFPASPLTAPYLRISVGTPAQIARLLSLLP